MIVGMLVVFVGLTFMAVLLVALKRVLVQDPDQSVSEQNANRENASGEINPHHLVVISAAVAAAVRGPVRVHKVILMGREAGRPWVTEGRVTIMGSHRPHRNW